MTANMNTGNQPQRSSHGGNQSRGGNYENPGGNSTGTMKTQMNANTTSGQPDNSELSRFMNNGGGPEPHQGSNPGAQSDPGPKEVGFYDKASNHMGGDDGVQSAAERPSPMHMGGYEGTPPNAGQRGGQNTGTSGAQTSASGGGTLGAETRKPVGFAASFDDGGAQSAATTQPMQPTYTGDSAMPGYTGDAGSEGYQGVYQSRAAQRLVDMRTDDQRATAPMGESYDGPPRAADKAGEVADAVKGKASGFFSRARDRMEDFLTVDLNSDGVIGSGTQARKEPYAGGSRVEPQDFETRETESRMEPQSFETRETMPYDTMPDDVPADADYGMSDQAHDASAVKDDSFSVYYGANADDGSGTAPVTGAGSRAEPRQRELVDA